MFKKTVNGVINKLSSMITDLEIVANEANAEAGVQDAKIAQATVQRNEADGERDRANRIREKLEELLS